MTSLAMNNNRPDLQCSEFLKTCYQGPRQRYDVAIMQDKVLVGIARSLFLHDATTFKIQWNLYGHQMWSLGHTASMQL
jgi:hypothetical protein